MSKPPEPRPRSSASVLTIDLVALSTSPDQRRVGPGRPALAADLHGQRVGLRRPRPRRSFSICRSLGRQLGDRLADREHLGDALRGDALRRACGWPRSRWRAARSRTRARRARWRRCRRPSRPRAARRRSARAPSRAIVDRRGARSAAGSRGTSRVTSTSTSQPCSLAAQVQASTIAADRVARLLPRRASAPRPRPGIAPATTFDAVPPSITPTLAVVSSSRRPSLIARDRRRRRLDRAAARPRAGSPRAPRRPRTRPTQALVGRRRGDHLADRASRGRARSRTASATRRGRAPSRRASPSSSATVNTSSSPAGGRRRRVAGGELDQHRHRGLVVGAEDRLAAAAKDAVGELHLDRPVVRERCRGGRRTPPSRRPRPGSGRSGCRPRARAAPPRRPRRPRPRARAARRARRRRPRARPRRARDLAEAHEAVEQALVAHRGRSRSAAPRRVPSLPMKLWSSPIRPSRSVDHPARRLIEVDAAVSRPAP